jgi:hypothetical protein
MTDRCVHDYGRSPETGFFTECHTCCKARIRDLEMIFDNCSRREKELRAAILELVAANDNTRGLDRPRPDIAWANLKRLVASPSVCTCSTDAINMCPACRAAKQAQRTNDACPSRSPTGGQCASRAGHFGNVHGDPKRQEEWVEDRPETPSYQHGLECPCPACVAATTAMVREQAFREGYEEGYSDGACQTATFDDDAAVERWRALVTGSTTR